MIALCSKLFGKVGKRDFPRSFYHLNAEQQGTVSEFEELYCVD